MGKKLYISIFIFIGLLVAGYFLIAQLRKDKTVSNPANNQGQATSSPQADFTVSGEKPAQISVETSAGKPKPEETQKPVASQTGDVVLEVPYINEAPSGIFVGPWKNACEEASIAMLEAYYTGKKSVSVKEAEAFMRQLFEKEDILYGSNANSDAARTAEIINKYTSYGAIVRQYPTLEEIKSEIDEGRPVITPNYGFGLQNPNIPFARTGSSYHMEVIIGYNDEVREFITNDSGDVRNGAGHRYDYDLFISTVRDYDYATNKVDGPMRAIFTFPK